jgi:hypothetical protein
MLPDLMPEGPRWWGDVRAALVVVLVLAFLFGASSYFVWVIRP